MVVDSRFYFALSDVSISPRIAGLVLTLHIDTRNERDPFSVRRPQFIVGARRKKRQAVRIAAVERDPVNLLLAVARREKRDPLAVRRSAGPNIAIAPRDLSRVAAFGGHEPDVLR